MKPIIGFAAIATLPFLAAGAMAATAMTPPDWAYPVTDPGFQRPKDNGTVYHLPGSAKAFTMTQINNPFSPPDWYPKDHPPMPEVVAHGRKPLVRACAQCHLPNGMGHPESAGLAGQPEGYIVQQMHDYADGHRKSMIAARSASMVRIAGAANEKEIAAAAKYFASLKPVKWIHVKESATAPKTYVGSGNMRHAVEGKNAGTEPLGQRIIEVPDNDHLAELRDSHSGFIAYVPPGSVAKGKMIVTTGDNGKSFQCAICHGPKLTGLGNVPGIAGRSPVYIVRQLMDIKSGARTGPSVQLMEAVVAKLTQQDMLNIAAYTASLNP